MYQLQKLLARRRAAVLAGAAVSLGLIGGLLVASFGWIEATEATRLATRQATRADAEAQRAFDALADAEEVTNYLIDLFEVADRTHANGQAIDLDVLLATGIERLNRDLEEQPVLRARLLQTIGRVYSGLGRLQQAEVTLDEVLELHEATAGAESFELIRTLRLLAAVNAEQADIERGDMLIDRALRLSLESHGENSVEFGRSLAVQGQIDYRAGRLDEATEILRQALPLLEAGLPEHHADFFLPLYFLTAALGDSGHCEEALALLERHLEVARAIGSENSLEIGRIYQVHGRCISVDDPHAALELFQRALEIGASVSTEESPFIADNLNNLGLMQRMTGQLEAAEKTLRRAEVALVRTRGAEHAHTASAVGELGIVLWMRGEHDRAADRLYRSLAILEKKYPRDHPWIGWNERWLGTVERDRENYDSAESHFLTALQILVEDDVERREAIKDYSELLRRLDRSDEIDRLAQ